MRNIKLETYRDIFKQFSIVNLEKTERVLSALQEYIKKHPTECFLGIFIEKLKCTENEVKTALPILEGIKNVIYPSKKEISNEQNNEGIMQIVMPTREVTLTKHNKLTGFDYTNIIENSLNEIQLFISKNKVVKNSKKIYLTLSNIGLKNEQNGEVYLIDGKRAMCIEILNKNSPLTAKEIGIKTKQKEKIIWDAIREINRIAISKLDINDDIIIPVNNGYILNPLYKIKITKNKISVDK